MTDAAEDDGRAGADDPRLDAGRLRDAALAYLARYATSAAHLRSVLLRRARRVGPEAAADPTVLARIDATVTALVAAGLVDDRAYAGTLARSLARRGASRRSMAHGMAARGIDRALAAPLIAATNELAAALAFARRRRLGPFRPEGERAGQRLRDLAALARRGFPAEVARRVIDAEDPQTLEAEAGGTGGE